MRNSTVFELLELDWVLSGVLGCLVNTRVAFDLLLCYK